MIVQVLQLGKRHLKNPLQYSSVEVEDLQEFFNNNNQFWIVFEHDDYKVNLEIGDKSIGISPFSDPQALLSLPTSPCKFYVGKVDLPMRYPKNLLIRSTH